MVDAAKWLEGLGCDFIVHHIGYEKKRVLPQMVSHAKSFRSTQRDSAGS
jgi:hypothetical protein